MFVHKIAGAAAEQGKDLPEVKRIAQKVIDNVASIGFAISSCTPPAKGTPIFELADENMEFGVGIHGEPGVATEKFVTSDELAEKMVARVKDNAVIQLKKGDEIAAVVLQVDAERERISLGVKQLAEDPFNNWVALNKKGAIVTGKVTAVVAKGATVELADGVEGYLRASEASRDRVEDATLVLSVGDEVEAKFTLQSLI